MVPGAGDYPLIWYRIGEGDFQMAVDKVGRNDLCNCGSGKKYKKCCADKSQWSRGSVLMVVLISALIVVGVGAVVRNFTTENEHVAKTSGVWDPVHGHYH